MAELFVCTWTGKRTWIVYIDDEATALAAATEVAAGEAPDFVKPLPPGGFYAEVVEDDDDEMGLEIDEHVETVIDALAGEALCEAEAELAGGEVVSCELAPHGSDVQHEATTKDGQTAHWD